ncbi:MAG: CoA-binding protein [Chloroflexi bacterium]|nr:CoA-binding protein [Chloroflexota bacterium]
MAKTIDPLVKDFLAQKRIAVVGVSRKEGAANLNYRKFKKAGYTVFAVNPNIETFDGDPCYRDLKSLPEKVDGVFIVTRPALTEKVVRERAELGLQRVWMHCVLGSTPTVAKDAAAKIGSASPEAVRLCRENGIAVIPGGCVSMFLEPDFGHACMRGMLRMAGALAA